MNTTNMKEYVIPAETSLAKVLRDNTEAQNQLYELCKQLKEDGRIEEREIKFASTYRSSQSYLMGAKEERQRLLKEIDGIKLTEVHIGPLFNAGYSQAIEEIKTKLLNK